ncbi:MAG: phage tail length tape measure family protein [Burkholderiaceae bacterium]
MTQDVEARFVADTSGFQAGMVQAATVTDAQMRRIVQYVQRATAANEAMERTARQAAAGAKASYENVSRAAEGAARSHAGASREVLILAHELSQGNYKRFGGSLLVLGEQLDIMGKLATPAGLAIGAIGAAALGAAAFMAKGAIEADRFAKSLIATHNAAGLTLDSLASMAVQVQASTGATVGAARSAIEALAASGKFGPATIEGAARAVVNMERTTGQTAEEIVKSFERMSEGVAKWAAENNSQYHYITAAQFEYLRVLEDQQGREAAERENLRLLNEQFTHVTDNLGYAAKAWNALKQAVSDYGDQVAKVGRPLTIGDQIDDITKQMQRMSTFKDDHFRLNTGDLPATQANFDALREQRGMLQRVQAAQEASARMEATAAATHAAGVAARQYGDDLVKAAKAQSELVRQQEAWKKAVDDAAKDGAPFKNDEIAAVDAYLKKHFAAPGAAAQASEYARLMDAVKSYSAGVDEQVAQQGKLSESERWLIQQHRDLENASAKLTTTQRASIAAAQEAAAANGASLDRLNQFRTLAEEVQKFNEGTRIAIGQQKALSEAERWAVEQRAKVAASKDLSSTERAGFGMAIDQSASDRDYADRMAAIKKFADQQIAAETLARATIGLTAEQADQAKKLAAYDNLVGNALVGANDDTVKRVQAAAAAIRGELLGSIKETAQAAQDFNDNFMAGIRLGMEEYAKSAADAAGQARKLVEDSMKGMEDAIVRFAETGKLSFKGLFTTIADDLLHMEARRDLAALFGAVPGGSAAPGASGTTIPVGLIGAAGSALANSNLIGSALDIFPTFANGIDYVPYDGFPAILHEGEKVTRRQDAAVDRSSQGPTVHLGGLTVNVGEGVSRTEVYAAASQAQQAAVAQVMRYARTGKVVGA